MSNMILKKEIASYIRKSSDIVFLTSDFSDVYDRKKILAVYRLLVKDGLLINVGYGVYAKAKKSVYTGKIIPASNLRDIAIDALNKIGVKVYPSTAELSYNRRETSQVPNEFVILVNKRIRRRIAYGKSVVRYEFK